MPLDLENGKVTIFRNDKGDNPKRPDYRGELKTPSGEQLRVSLWVSESKKGQKYFSGQVDAPQEQQVTTNGSSGGSGDDSLPF